MNFLSLAMMVKNEAHTIAATLRSCASVVDHVHLLDTGSTDGTIERAKAVAQELDKGITVFEVPFVDFATSRNVLLDSVGNKSTFLLLLDADDKLEGDSVLHRHLKIDKTFLDAWMVRVTVGSRSFFSTRVVRTSARLRYVGKVHEYVDVPAGRGGVLRDYRVAIKHRSTSDESTVLRLLRDVEILKDDTSPRGLFYYAETLRALGRTVDAEVAYRQRIAVSFAKGDEEVFASLMAVASLVKDNSKEFYLKRAYRYAPHRQEPLCALAEFAMESGDAAMAFLYAFTAFQLKYPTKDTLFIDESVHQVGTARVLAKACAAIGPQDEQKWAIGIKAARIVAAVAPHDIDTQMLLIAFQVTGSPMPQAEAS